MFFNMKALSVAAMLAAVSPALAQTTTTTREICTTQLGTNSLASVPTTTLTSTTSVKAIVRATSTPSTTVTPTATTSTVIASSFTTTTETSTISRSTSTFSTTQTILAVATTTFTDSTTLTRVLTTTTVTTPTTTIGTVSGFIPIASNNPGAAQKLRRQARPRPSSSTRAAVAASVRASAAASVRASVSIPNLPRLAVVSGRVAAVSGPSQYPTTVTCNDYVSVISTSTVTVTARTSAVVLAAQPTSFTTVTPTFTSTVTTNLVPASTTTTLFTTTTTTVSTTVTTTIVTSTTTTATLAAAPSAFYAACTADNQITNVNGAPITNNAALLLGTIDVATATDCCVLCQQNNICAGSAFSQPVAAGGLGRCQLFAEISGTCDPTLFAFLFYENGQNLNGGTASPLTVSNGNCGYGLDGGQGPQPSPSPAAQ